MQLYAGRSSKSGLHNSLHQIIENCPLPPNTPAQKAKIIALTQALILGNINP